MLECRLRPSPKRSLSKDIPKRPSKSVTKSKRLSKMSKPTQQQNSINELTFLDVSLAKNPTVKAGEPHKTNGVQIFVPIKKQSNKLKRVQSVSKDINQSDTPKEERYQQPRRQIMRVDPNTNTVQVFGMFSEGHNHSVERERKYSQNVSMGRRRNVSCRSLQCAPIGSDNQCASQAYPNDRMLRKGLLKSPTRQTSIKVEFPLKQKLKSTCPGNRTSLHSYSSVLNVGQRGAVIVPTVKRLPKSSQIIQVDSKLNDNGQPGTVSAMTKKKKSLSRIHVSNVLNSQKENKAKLQHKHKEKSKVNRVKPNEQINEDYPSNKYLSTTNEDTQTNQSKKRPACSQKASLKIHPISLLNILSDGTGVINSSFGDHQNSQVSSEVSQRLRTETFDSHHKSNSNQLYNKVLGQEELSQAQVHQLKSYSKCRKSFDYQNTPNKGIVQKNRNEVNEKKTQLLKIKEQIMPLFSCLSNQQLKVMALVVLIQRQWRLYRVKRLLKKLKNGTAICAVSSQNAGKNNCQEIDGDRNDQHVLIAHNTRTQTIKREDNGFQLPKSINPNETNRHSSINQQMQTQTSKQPLMVIPPIKPSSFDQKFPSYPIILNTSRLALQDVFPSVNYIEVRKQQLKINYIDTVIRLKEDLQRGYIETTIYLKLKQNAWDKYESSIEQLKKVKHDIKKGCLKLINCLNMLKTRSQGLRRVSSTGGFTSLLYKKVFFFDEAIDDPNDRSDSLGHLEATLLIRKKQQWQKMSPRLTNQFTMTAHESLKIKIDDSWKRRSRTMQFKARKEGSQNNKNHLQSEGLQSYEELPKPNNKQPESGFTSKRRNNVNSIPKIAYLQTIQSPSPTAAPSPIQQLTETPANRLNDSPYNNCHLNDLLSPDIRDDTCPEFKRSSLQQFRIASEQLLVTPPNYGDRQRQGWFNKSHNIKECIAVGSSYQLLKGKYSLALQTAPNLIETQLLQLILHELTLELGAQLVKIPTKRHQSYLSEDEKSSMELKAMPYQASQPKYQKYSQRLNFDKATIEDSSQSQQDYFQQHQQRHKVTKHPLLHQHYKKKLKEDQYISLLRSPQKLFEQAEKSFSLSLIATDNGIDRLTQINNFPIWSNKGAEIYLESLVEYILSPQILSTLKLQAFLKPFSTNCKTLKLLRLSCLSAGSGWIDNLSDEQQDNYESIVQVDDLSPKQLSQVETQQIKDYLGVERQTEGSLIDSPPEIIGQSIFETHRKLHLEKSQHNINRHNGSGAAAQISLIARKQLPPNQTKLQQSIYSLIFERCLFDAFCFELEQLAYEWRTGKTAEKSFLKGSIKKSTHQSNDLLIALLKQSYKQLIQNMSWKCGIIGQNHDSIDESEEAQEEQVGLAQWRITLYNIVSYYMH